jgi:hypothetical protein
VGVVTRLPALRNSELSLVYRFFRLAEESAKKSEILVKWMKNVPQELKPTSIYIVVRNG